MPQYVPKTNAFKLVKRTLREFMRGIGLRTIYTYLTHFMFI